MMSQDMEVTVVGGSLKQSSTDEPLWGTQHKPVQEEGGSDCWTKADSLWSVQARESQIKGKKHQLNTKPL